jgi:hypothetical protein
VWLAGAGVKAPFSYGATDEFGYQAAEQVTEADEKLFDSPLDGWAFRAAQRLAPLVGKITADYDVGLVYFIADAAADGTATPHHGDGARFDVMLTVRDAKLPSPPSFEEDILPILAQNCQDCHGADLQEAKLDLRTLSAMLRGGESGPAVVPGAPQDSLPIDLVARGQMPPSEDGKLTSAELATLRRWVQARTPAEEKIVVLPPHAQVTDEDRSFWAFQPPRKAAEPRVQSTDRVRTPIDAFLLARLESQGLTFSPEADRNVLIRRAYFDLIGLPPEPAAVKAFAEDPRPQAYESLIDQLLASPHYGERWGRHWLVAAGYVDGKLDNDLATIYPKCLEIFDAPIMPVNCTQRLNSATVLQSLTLLNSEFLFEHSDRLAARVAESAGGEPAAAIQLAFWLALARPPTDAETRQSQAFLAEQAAGYESPQTPKEKAARMALADLCHMLLSSNELLYVD